MKFYGFCKDSKCATEVLPAENFKVLTGSIAMKSGVGSAVIDLGDGDYYLLSLGLRTTWNATNEYRFANYEPELTPTVTIKNNELTIKLKDTVGSTTAGVQYKVVLFKAD